MDQKRTFTQNMSVASVCLALCLVLPFFTGQDQAWGNALCPMHIPVLLCGFLCGWPWGLAVGFIAPLFRCLLFGMPPFYPVAIAMAFELAVYGLLTGLFYRLLPKKLPFFYVSLIIAMVGGRLVWGAARCVMLFVKDTPFTFEIFLTSAVVNAVPGIILQILIVPALVHLLRRAKLAA